MRLGVWVASLVFAGIMAGCTLPSTETVDATASPPPTISSPTAAPVVYFEPTNTPVPRPVYATGRSLPVNCRFGPGTIYEAISRLDAGQSSRVDGKDSTGAWMYIHDPLNPGGFCWVSTAPVDIEGDALTLPVVSPPYVTVTRVDVLVEPERITVTCDNFPQYALFVADITANGPTVVNWRWELSTGEVTDAAVMLFDQAETKTVQKGIVVQAPNDYVGKLHINAPNEIAGEAILVANCTP
jgi:hypothetical protein